MPDRTAPYPSYNYLVDLKGPRSPEKPLGGFSEIAGLKTEMHISEYRDGNDANPHVRKIPGVHTVGDTTLKRGVVDSSDLWAWMTQTRTQSIDAQRDVTITMRDEAGNAVQIYKLFLWVPKSITGPAFNGKGAGDVAIEELVIASEGFEISPAS